MKKSKKITVYAFVLGLTLLLAGCEGSYSPLGWNQYNNESGPSGSYDTSANYDQQIIHQVSGTIETKTFDDDITQLDDVIEAHQGVISSRDTDTYYDQYINTPLNSVYLTINIPKDQLESFVEALDENFRLSDYNIYSYDASPTLSDNEQRLQEINKRLAEIESELDDENLRSSERVLLREEQMSLEDEKRMIENEQESTMDDVEFSSVSIRVREVLRYWDEGPSLWHIIRSAFSGFFSYAIPALVASLISLFFVIPYIIVGVITYLIIRKLTNRWIHGIKKKESVLLTKDKDKQ